MKLAIRISFYLGLLIFSLLSLPIVLACILPAIIILVFCIYLAPYVIWAFESDSNLEEIIQEHKKHVPSFFKGFIE